MHNIQMVDLRGQYHKIKSEIDASILECLESTAHINGPQVVAFQQKMEQYLGCKHVVPCANGTDALQIALMALGLKPGDEVIVPCFTYVATAEVIGLLGFTPVMVDVDRDTFNITAELIRPAITERTKAIVPVHLFGQCADMEPIMQLAKTHGIWVIEDNAQAIGADYTFSDGRVCKAGAIGDIGCTSFYPSKNLGCYGDGGAIFTNSSELNDKIRKIANHGQSKRYYHDVIGVNSRLDNIQAAVLNIKLPRLDAYAMARQEAAAFYDQAFSGIKDLIVPARQPNSTHVFHQYTLLVMNGKRDELQEFLKERGVPSMVYYPVPLYKQEAFAHYQSPEFNLETTEFLCQRVISLPMHTELDAASLRYITETVKSFF